MHRLPKLKVYQKALLLSKETRTITKRFPSQELFGLTSQFTRAVDSIVLNIAEGAGNLSNKEFLRFLSYSTRSSFECLGCLDIALTNSYINETEHASLAARINEVIAMIHGLRKTLTQNRSIVSILEP